MSAVKFQFLRETCRLIGSRYIDNDAPAVRVVSEMGEPMASLTVNMPPHIPSEGEIFVKAWSENERLADTLRDTVFFEDTGRRVSNGYIEAEVWRVKADIDFGPKH